MKELTVTQRVSTRRIVTIGMLSAISIVLGYTNLGFIPIPPAKATILHIPVIIGAILEGPAVGAAIGLFFGLFSIYSAFTAPTPISFMFYNPIVSVLPRILIGITAYYAYRLLRDKNKPLAITLGAVIGTLTNTAGVLSAIYFIYAAQWATTFKVSLTAAKVAIIGVGLTNGIPEMIVSALITVPVVMAVSKVMRR